MQIGSVSNVVTQALDGLTLRQQVIAQNIANLNTPGYTPLRVDFESALQGMEGAGPRILPDTRMTPTGSPSGAAAELSRQVSQLADTALRYQTLIKGINKQLAIMQLVVSDGRR
ncbi:flagellar basal body protein [Chromobacterium vaccinii]|uniref:flagellar basal body rod protein FlgB n=1 Tax=Chromobacterium vaccinii TaxID=1108595 RepID=UPI000617B796|nr:flagellar basal body protein [Chromobacterium vaccinii]MCD4487142.1 flagellar basal body protein [Chromobacterium vaccinii]MCD4501040.1 flagellar basal body protein [Chromobacterium vaccinii]QND84819.1 Flagellar basal-body rod protein FlgB [Chromobacterium vaccinii]QND90050.1 Flagellar basal-body rod protein FlgB [Chromobacterium vaccinii]